jgi:hypothetical protein
LRRVRDGTLNGERLLSSLSEVLNPGKGVSEEAADGGRAPLP